MVRAKDGRTLWIYVGLPGHEAEAGRELDEATINRLRPPRKFYELVRAELTPGATKLMTRSRVGDEGRRERLTIMDAVIPEP